MNTGPSAACTSGNKTVSVQALVETWHLILCVSQFWDARRSTTASTSSKQEQQALVSLLRQDTWQHKAWSCTFTALQWRNQPEQKSQILQLCTSLPEHTERTSSCFGSEVWTSTAWLGFTASFAVPGSTKRERSGKAETDCYFQELRAKVLFSYTVRSNFCLQAALPLLRTIISIPTKGSFPYSPSSGGAGKGSFRGGVRPTEKDLNNKQMKEHPRLQINGKSTLEQRNLQQLHTWG